MSFQTKVVECCLLGYFTGGGRRVVGILGFDIIVTGGDIVLLLFTGQLNIWNEFMIIHKRYWCSFQLLEPVLFFHVQ